MSTTPEIVLYQMARGPRAPSFSPFALKLETFLRMAKINYTNSLRGKPSKKGKIPWITYNGEVVPDSQFCIEYLNKKLNIDLNKHLTVEQKAVARAFQRLAEENLFWCLAMCRLQLLDWVGKCMKFPKLIVWIGSRKYLHQAKAQGVGRHSFDEIVHIMEGDLRALSDYLGSKKFFFGDEPCETDAALFGQLCQIYLQIPTSRGEQLMREKFPNLVEYCERMKDTFWPDWEECNTNDGTKEATK